MARRWRFWRKPPPGLTPGQIFRMLIDDEQAAGRLTDIDTPTHSHSFETYESDWWTEPYPEDHWLEFDGERIDPDAAIYITGGEPHVLGAYWSGVPDEWPDPDAMWIGPDESRLRGWWRVQQWRLRRRIRAIQRLLHIHQRRTERSDHESDEDL